MRESAKVDMNVGFFVGQVSQLWVIKDLIEKRLNDMGETGVEVRVSK